MPITIPRNNSDLSVIRTEGDLARLSATGNRYVIYLCTTGKGGHGEFATGTVLMNDGLLAAGSFKTSPYHWIIKHQPSVCKEPEKQFQVIRERLVAVRDEFFVNNQDVKANYYRLQAITRILGDVSDIDSSEVSAELVALKIAKLRDAEAEQVLFMNNGFFIDDLSGARKLIQEGRAGRAILQYLAGIDAQKIDVMKGSAFLEMGISPAMLNAGRWPSSPHVSLRAGQQAACNVAYQYLKKTGGMFSLNGPPGTGKTTALKQVIASVLTDRAVQLMKLDTPESGFINNGVMTVRGRDIDCYELIPALRQSGIVVASSNNNAVENISVQIPGNASVDTDLLNSSGLDYYRDVAQAIMGRGHWGMIASVLGRFENVSKFVNLFWFAPKEAGEGGYFRAWLQGQDEVRGRHEFFKAQEAFQEALTRFIRLQQALVHIHTCQLDMRDTELDLESVRLKRAGREKSGKGRVFQAVMSFLRDWGLDRAEKRYQSVMAESSLALQSLIERYPYHLLPLSVGGQGRAADVQNSQGWLHLELEEVRNQVFMAALCLHKAFVVANKERMRANLSLWADVLTKRNDPASESQITGLWDTYFMVVPVVSTTFASAGRLFEGVASEGIGWSMIDEAGQATPQSPVGLAVKSKRVLCIGDPKQIKPVVAIPGSVTSSLRKTMKISDRFDAGMQSVQTVADQGNPFGTVIDDEEGTAWVGFPLRLHYRCDDPMFGIANQIAYSNQMVNGKQKTDCRLPISQWIPNQNTGEGKHWHASFMDDILRLLNKVDDPDWFIITPFVETATMIRKGLAGKGSNLDRIGTIHTFQGREARCVILVLCYDKRRPKAVSWAAGEPNLLNVAVTRACERLYVIGDRSVWARENYFNVMAEKVVAA